MTVQTESNTEFSYRYVHTRSRTLARWLQYFGLMLIGALSLVLLANSYAQGGLGRTVLATAYLAALLGCALASAAMMLRVLACDTVGVSAGVLTLPHFQRTRVPLEDVRAIHVNPLQPHLVAIAAEGRLSYHIDARALAPSVEAHELVHRLQAATAAHVGDGAVQSLHRAQALAHAQAEPPWVSIGLASTIVAILGVQVLCGTRLDPLDMIALGAPYRPIPLPMEPLRIIDGVLLHSGWLHALMNALGMLVAGAAVERLVGWRFLLAAFVVGGCVATLVSRALLDIDLRLGASGGAYAMFGVYARLLVAQPAPMPATIIGIPARVGIPALLVGFGILQPGIDWVAHLAGFGFGYCATWYAYRTAMPASGATTIVLKLHPAIPIASMFILGLGVADIAQRMSTLTGASRARALTTVLGTNAPTAAITELAWSALVTTPENRHLVPNAIEALNRRRDLSPDDESVLATLRFVAGQHDAAIRTELSAFLRKRQEASNALSGSAARIARFALPATKLKSYVGATTCGVNVEVQWRREVPTGISVHSSAPADSGARNSPACTPVATYQRIDGSDWSHTLAATPVSHH